MNNYEMDCKFTKEKLKLLIHNTVPRNNEGLLSRVLVTLYHHPFTAGYWLPSSVPGTITNFTRCTYFGWCIDYNY